MCCALWGNRKSPGRFAINPKRPGPDMKKADRISRKKFLWKLSAAFNNLLSPGEGFRQNLRKNFLIRGSNCSLIGFYASSSPTWLEKRGFGIYGKTLYFFWPPDMQKTQEFPGFFGVVSFLIYPSGRVEQKRYQLLAPPLAYITREARAISPRRRGPYHLRAFPLLWRYVSYFRFAAK